MKVMEGSWQMKLTAMVFMPVKLVTVAEPPRISIDDTIILVARLSTVFSARVA
jgi:hypothetical protein